MKVTTAWDCDVVKTKSHASPVRPCAAAGALVHKGLPVSSRPHSQGPVLHGEIQPKTGWRLILESQASVSTTSMLLFRNTWPRLMVPVRLWCCTPSSNPEHLISPPPPGLRVRGSCQLWCGPHSPSSLLTAFPVLRLLPHTRPRWAPAPGKDTCAHHPHLHLSYSISRLQLKRLFTLFFTNKALSFRSFSLVST